MVLGDILRRNASYWPGKTGFVHGNNRYTWYQVNERVNRLANGLISLGLEKGERVAILANNCNQILESFFATAKTGLVSVPVNIRLSSKEVSFILNDSETSAVIVQKGLEGNLETIRDQLPNLRFIIGIGEGHGCRYDFESLIEEGSPLEPQVEVEENDVFMIPYTSGTTGRPKGPILTHKMHCAAATLEALDFEVMPNYTCAVVAPLFFLGGWNGSALYSILRGCTTVIIDWDPQGVLEAIEKEKINHITLVPTMVNMLMNHPDIYKYDRSSLRTLLYAGSAMPFEHVLLAQEIFGPVLLSPFGCTESCTTGTVLHKGEFIYTGTKEAMRRNASVGKPMVNIDVEVVDENGEQVPPGSDKVGEVRFKGDSVTIEYWKAPELTKEFIKDGWWYSGDLVTVDKEGYIYVVDRKKDMIVSGGINIYPREIEEVIYTHPAVLHAAVIGVPDERWGETVKAVIVLKDGKEAKAEEIIDLCKANLASYKKPTSIEFVNSLPMTATGKILKRELRDKYWVGRERKV